MKGSSEDQHFVDIHVGQRVTALRNSHGYTQAELATAIGVTFQQVQKYEKGANRISASRLWEIADFLNVDVAVFFEGLLRRDNGEIVFVPEGEISGTRQSIEIARLAPALSGRSQRTVLELVRLLAAQPTAAD